MRTTGDIGSERCLALSGQEWNNLPPARLVGYFATHAPICVIARRGPSRYTQLILWNTETDEFTPGQWAKGHVDYATLSSKGTHMALGIMGASSKIYSASEIQIALVCRPPYFEALEMIVGGLCATTIAFLPDDLLYAKVHESRELGAFEFARRKCPFKRVEIWPIKRDQAHKIDASWGPMDGFDQGGRAILFEAGRVLDISGAEPVLLFDTNPLRPAVVETPDWAKEW